MEEELRKQENLIGTPMQLGDGETWTVPSLPINDEGERIAGMLEVIVKKEEEGVDNKEAMALYFDFMYSMTVQNYPKLTQEYAREVGLFHVGMIAEFVPAMTGSPPKA